MRASHTLLVLAAGATAHEEPVVEARQALTTARPTPLSDDYISTMLKCSSAIKTLLQAEPSAPTEIISYTSAAFASVMSQGSKVTDFCQIWSTIPPPLTKLISDYESSMAYYAPWFATERAKVPESLCPSGFYDNISLRPIQCTPGEQRPNWAQIPTETSSGMNPSETVIGTYKIGPRPTNATTTSGTPTSSGSSAAPTTPVPAGAASNVVAVGLAAVAFIGAVAAL